MKYLLAIKTIDTNEVEIFEFDSEFEREDIAFKLMKDCKGLSLGYTQEDWVVDGGQILYCHEPFYQQGSHWVPLLNWVCRINTMGIKLGSEFKKEA